MAARDLRHPEDLGNPRGLGDLGDLGALGEELDRLAVEVAALARAVAAALADCGGPALGLAAGIAPLSALAAPDDPRARRLLARHDGVRSHR